MAVIKANTEDVRTPARLMRAEAEGEGDQGMPIVGNVGVIRIITSGLDFKNIRSVNDRVFQSHGSFEAPQGFSDPQAAVRIHGSIMNSNY